MYPGTYATSTPDKPAYIMAATGEAVTFKQLDDRSNQVAQLLWERGLRPGDSVAVFMENNPAFFEITWAAQRSGLYYTAVSSRLTAPEVAYIVNDCGAKAFFTSAARADVAVDVLAEIPDAEVRVMVGDPAAGPPSAAEAAGFEDYAEEVGRQPPEPLEHEIEGQDMLYSSGTTGRPKGVRVPLSNAPAGSGGFGVTLILQGLYGMTADDVYLSPAPLYHAAPLRFSMSAQRLGATVVVMERFDPVEFLEVVQRYRITYTQVVPTMFVRLLKLPEHERTGYDTSSLKCVIHAAAPCPVPVKAQMIDWWGPIINEYYSGTEGNGFTAISSQDWMTHQGSVGRPLLGVIHILDDDGEELPSGEPGTVYFESPSQFEYHNDPEKTKASRNDKGWSTLGDVGYVDAEGYLYLTDRKAYMIISGGVNIYPQEAENVLITHPKVMDCAVFGVPNEEFGEEVKAVVQPMDMADAGPALEQELIDFCKAQLASYKCPRSVDFDAELPRHPTGKLFKRLLKDRYWAQRDTSAA